MSRRTKGTKPGLARARSAIAGLAPADTVTLEAAAIRLQTSRRTLQRRRQWGGLKSWALVEQSRFEIAGTLLRETDPNAREIAARPGCGTPSAFARACTN